MNYLDISTFECAIYCEVTDGLCKRNCPLDRNVIDFMRTFTGWSSELHEEIITFQLRWKILIKIITISYEKKNPNIILIFSNLKTAAYSVHFEQPQTAQCGRLTKAKRGIKNAIIVHCVYLTFLLCATNRWQRKLNKISLTLRGKQLTQNILKFRLKFDSIQHILRRIFISFYFFGSHKYLCGYDLAILK